MLNRVWKDKSKFTGRLMKAFQQAWEAVGSSTRTDLRTKASASRTTYESDDRFEMMVIMISPADERLLLGQVLDGDAGPELKKEAEATGSIRQIFNDRLLGCRVSFDASASCVKVSALRMSIPIDPPRQATKP